MNINLSNIITSCLTLHDADDEVSKKFFLFRGKYKKEVEELRSKIKEKINALDNDEWTIEYLYDLEHTLFAYWDIVGQYMFKNNLSIPDFEVHDKKIVDTSVFHTIYFSDTKCRLILLDIISDNINFTIFDTATGNSFTTVSVGKVQHSQMKIENICKHAIVKGLLDFADRYKKSK